MYNMLADEVKWANADGEPYQFTHLIFISRVYHLSEEEESTLANSASTRRSRPTETNSSLKKQKKQRPPEGEQNGGTRPADGIYPYHPEDDILIKSALHSVTYPYVAPLPALVQETRARDAFGLDIRGRVVLVAGGGEMLRELGGRMAEMFGRG